MNDRLLPFKDKETYKSLSEWEQKFIAEKANDYQLSFQDVKILIDINRDLHTWGEGSLDQLWKTPPESKVTGKQLKKIIIDDIKSKWNTLKNELKDYTNFEAKTDSINLPINYIQSEKEGSILGDCPVASVKTRCCNLKTLDVVNNCGFDCSYCSIQSFFDNNRVYFQKNFKEKLNKLSIDKNKNYHIGTGQSSDSLMWGNREGILDQLCDFAQKNRNVILELKTKSKNISWLLENEIPKNILVTWSLNSQTIIDKEEHFTASLNERLQCARKCADKGIVIGFHLHPMVYYKGWNEEYAFVFSQIQKLFKPDEVALISLGTLTFIKGVIKKIRDRDLKSKILQMPFENASGKISYPQEIKMELFTKAYEAFSEKWKEEVFFYLCMEDESLWKPVLGRSYMSNEDFEDDMITALRRKIGL